MTSPIDTELNELTYKLARDFSDVLQEWLSPEELREAVERNNAEAAAGICHSHDHCDANMAMDAAFRINGIDPAIDHDWEDNPRNWRITSLWNDAWDLAKENGFYVRDGKPEGSVEDLLRETVAALNAQGIPAVHWRYDVPGHPGEIQIKSERGILQCNDRESNGQEYTTPFFVLAWLSFNGHDKDLGVTDVPVEAYGPLTAKYLALEIAKAQAEDVKECR